MSDEYNPAELLQGDYGISPKGAETLKKLLVGLTESGEFDMNAAENKMHLAEWEDSIGQETAAVEIAAQAAEAPEAPDANPYLHPDERLEDVAKHYSEEELHELELHEPEIAERIVNALVHADKTERAKDRRLKAGVELAENAKMQQEILHDRAVQIYRSQYWGLTQSQREEAAEELGLDLAKFEPPSGPYGNAGDIE